MTIKKSGLSTKDTTRFYFQTETVQKKKLHSVKNYEISFIQQFNSINACLPQILTHKRNSLTRLATGR